MNKYVERLYNGIIKEIQLDFNVRNVSYSCSNNFFCQWIRNGLTTMIVLAASNFMISFLRKIIPERMRIPSYIVIVASMVTIVQLLLQAYLPSLYDTLGIYIPLIVVKLYHFRDELKLTLQNIVAFYRYLMVLVWGS